MGTIYPITMYTGGGRDGDGGNGGTVCARCSYLWHSNSFFLIIIVWNLTAM